MGGLHIFQLPVAPKASDRLEPQRRAHNRAFALHACMVPFENNLRSYFADVSRHLAVYRQAGREPDVPLRATFATIIATRRDCVKHVPGRPFSNDYPFDSKFWQAPRVKSNFAETIQQGLNREESES